MLEKSLAVGLGGILSDGVRKSLRVSPLNAYTVIAGLGGRAIPRTSLKQLFEDAARDELEQDDLHGPERRILLHGSWNASRDRGATLTRR